MGPVWQLEAYDMPSVTDDGRTVVAVVEEGKRLKAFDAESGAVRWTVEPPPGRTWAREEALGDGAIVLYADPERVKGACRVEAGRTRWCTPFDRPLRDLVVANGAIGVADQYRNLSLLDPDTGKPLGDWLPGGEMHIYFDLSQPHDTIFVPGAQVIGRFSGWTVVATGSGLEGRAAGKPPWTHPIGGGGGMRIGGFGGGLSFGHRLALDVNAADRILLVGGELLSIGDGKVAWSRPVEARRLTVVGDRAVLFLADAAVGLAPDGTERWRTPTTGLGAIAGEEGVIGGIDEGVVPEITWLDADGGLLGKTPVPAGIALVAAPCGVAFRAEVWTCRKIGGDPVWSAGEAVDFEGRYALAYDTGKPTRILDAATGAPLAEIEGSIYLRAGSMLVGSIGTGKYGVYRGP